MASSPCTVCGQRFLGRATYFYPAVLKEAGPERQTLKLCPRHAKNVLNNLHDATELRVDTGVFESRDWDICLICGGDASQQMSSVYITCYPAKDERQDFWGFGCPSCAPSDLIATLDDTPPRTRKN